MWVVHLTGSNPSLCLQLDSNTEYAWGTALSSALGFSDKASATAFSRTLIEQSEVVSESGTGETWYVKRTGSDPSEYLEVDGNGLFEWALTTTPALKFDSQVDAQKVADFVASALGAAEPEQQV